MSISAFRLSAAPPPIELRPSIELNAEIQRKTSLLPHLVFVRRERVGIISDRGIEAAPDLVALFTVN